MWAARVSLYPAAGSNVIAVGVVDSIKTDDLATKLADFSMVSTEHSTYGPTNEGRCKPDIVAAGNCLAADVNDPNIYKPTGSWSSFSTPVAAGALGLLVQKAKSDPQLSSAISANGGNCVIKAIVLNSAKKLAYWHKGRLTKDDDHSAPLDFIQGAGLLDAVGAYENLTAGQFKPGLCPNTGWDLEQTDKDPGIENVYEIEIDKPAKKVIAATIVWNKHYDGTYPFKAAAHKDDDLKIELWAIDPNNPQNDYLMDYSDSKVDNLEHIYCIADANYTNYELVVTYGESVVAEVDAGQLYGFAWSVEDFSFQDKDSNGFWYDLNADGVVDEKDLAVLVKNWLGSQQLGGGYYTGDLNDDGLINADDMKILMDRLSEAG